MRALTLAAAVGAACAACGGNPLAPTTAQPSPVPGASASGPRISLTNFIAFGDSITWGQDGRNFESDPLGLLRTQVRVTSPYPTVLGYDLQAPYPAQVIGVENDGCPGEAARNTDPTNGAESDCAGAGLLPVPRFDQLISVGGFQAVLLMEGANDVDVDDPIPALRTMVEDAKTRGLRVFLATIPPEQQNANPSPLARNRPNADVAMLNMHIRALASSENVALVDVYQAFPSPDSNDLYALGLLSRDGLHPLEGGYELIAKTFFNAIAAALELPPATVAPTSTKAAVSEARAPLH